MTGPDDLAAAAAAAAGGDADVLPRALCDAHAVLDTSGAPSGVVWRLAEAGRQLDANLLNLPAGRAIDTHTESELDVLIVVFAGSATFTSGGVQLTVRSGQLVWLPRGCIRGLVAGSDGLTYLTVHRRRPGMRIRIGR